jgi:hypothetical protein
MQNQNIMYHSSMLVNFEEYNITAIIGNICINHTVYLGKHWFKHIHVKYIIRCVDVFIQSVLDMDCSLYCIEYRMHGCHYSAPVDRLPCRLHISSAVVFNFIYVCLLFWYCPKIILSSYHVGLTSVSRWVNLSSYMAFYFLFILSPTDARVSHYLAFTRIYARDTTICCNMFEQIVSDGIISFIWFAAYIVLECPRGVIEDSIPIFEWTSFQYRNNSHFIYRHSPKMRAEFTKCQISSPHSSGICRAPRPLPEEWDELIYKLTFGAFSRTFGLLWLKKTVQRECVLWPVRKIKQNFIDIVCK